jgi:hypothetical protein
MDINYKKELTQSIMKIFNVKCVDCNSIEFSFVNNLTTLIKCDKCDFYYQLKSFKKTVVDPEASCVPITKPRFVTKIYKEWVPIYYTCGIKL